MKKDIIIRVCIYLVLFGLIIVSIFDAPRLPNDAFSILLITWLFYETIDQKVKISHLTDEIRMIKEMIKGWKSTNSQRL